MKSVYCFILLLFCFLESVLAEDLFHGGHLKYQAGVSKYRKSDLNASLGPSEPHQHDLDLRMKLQKKSDAFNFIIHGEYLGIGGDGLEASRAASSFFNSSFSPLPEDDTRLFDLTKEVNDDKHYTSVARLDRLHISYSQDQLVLKAGRQAVSWGNSLVFPVLDLFNPFSPVEIDKDYKTGDDLLYAQWLFATGADLQGLIIPRRDRGTGDIEQEQSSAAIKYHGRSNSTDVDFDLLFAYHYDDYLYGIGFSKSFLQAVWRCDLLLADYSNENTVNLTTGIDRSWVIYNKNVYGYIEYFHSGGGLSSTNQEDIDDILIDRLSRGELFTLTKNYLALGLQIETTPLTNIFLSQILNLDDGSGFSQVRAEYNIVQDFLLTAGIDFPYGGRESEFGGIPVSLTGLTEQDLYLSRGKSVYLRISYYL